MSRWPLVLVLAATMATGCRGSSDQAENTSVVEPGLPDDPWAYASGPAWVRVDLEALRDDERFAAIWDAAGDRSADPLADLVSNADAWIVSWPEPTFTERLNVAVGVDDGALDSLVPTEGRIEYAAGRGTVIGHPDREWVYATPAPGLLLTGTPEAVRAAVGRPCIDCGGPSSGFGAQLSVTEGHRRLAGVVLDEPALRVLVESVASVEAEAVLGLGVDVVIRIEGAEGTNLADVRALTEVGVDLARRELENAQRPSGLLDGIRIVPSETGVRLDWEIGSQWLTAFANAVVTDLK